MEKVQWNSNDKKQNGLKYSKNDKSSTLPRIKITLLSLQSKNKLEAPLGIPIFAMSKLSPNHWNV